MTLLSSLILSGFMSLSANVASSHQTDAPLTETVIIEITNQLNAPYNAFLEKYISEGDGVHLVDYANVSDEDKAALKTYISTLEAQTPSMMGTDEEKLAFYFNVYNAKTIDIILDNYPVESIRDIGGGLILKGPWRKPVLTIEGERLSLDNIEHDIVRKNFAEPRVHYAFNCASIGCPNLKTSAWEAATLDEDLNIAARAFIAHPRGISIDANGKVKASSIFKWFKKDFGSNDQEVLDHIRQFTVGDKASALGASSKIHAYGYDWSLNEQ